MNWVLQIMDGKGKVIRSWTGTQLWVDLWWNGKDQNGNIAPDGKYRCTVTGSDLYGNAMTPKTKTITVDTTSPTIEGITHSPDPFNPKAGQTTTISYTLSEKCTITIQIYDSVGNLVRTLKKNQLAGANSMVWDGKNRYGKIVSDGTYTYKMYVTDTAGNKATTYPITRTVIVNST